MDVGLRRTLLWAFAGVALAALLLAIVVTAIAPVNAVAWLVGALVILALAVIAEVVVLFVGSEGEHRPRRVAGAVPSRPQAGPASTRADDLLLRCSACNRTFTAFDDGARPLSTLCPHCGQRGVIDAPTA